MAQQPIPDETVAKEGWDTSGRAQKRLWCTLNHDSRVQMDQFITFYANGGTMGVRGGKGLILFLGYTGIGHLLSPMRRPPEADAMKP